MAQGNYLPDEIANNAGDSLDAGGDGVPEVLRITVRPTVDDPGVLGTVAFALNPSSSDCPTAIRDWSHYSSLQFFMALDNYRKVIDLGGGVTVTISREALFSLVLQDSSSPSRQLEYHLTLDDVPVAGGQKYLSAQWGNAAYIPPVAGGDVQDPSPGGDGYSTGVLPRWKRVEVSYAALKDPVSNWDENFRFNDIRQLQFRLDSIGLSWTRSDTLGKREVKPAADGRLKYFSENGGEFSITKAADGHFQYEDPPGSVLNVPCDASGNCWGMDPVANPISEAGFVTSLRMDRMILPGVAAAGRWLDYGLPGCFSLDVAQRRELTAEEAAR
jgi:hypothetical protein